MGDIVFRGGLAGTILACLLENGVLLVMVEAMTHTAVVSEHAASWMPSGNREIWRAAEVEQCLAWRPSVDGRLVVLNR